MKELNYQVSIINTYDPCVANRTIYGKKMTMYVDDLKTSHVDEKEVTKTTERIQSVYDKDMQVSQVNKHDYLGMDIDFTFPGEVVIKMTPLLNSVIEEFPEEIQGREKTLAA